jgi:uncharacterized protein YndB with AHSA1/START domain
MTDTSLATRSVVVERLMAHPPQKIWRALTQGHLIAEWLMTNDFRPVVGATFELRTDPMPHWDGVVQGEVLEVEPNARLVYSWKTSAGMDTRVAWTLTAVPGGTRVRMEQSGFRADEEANYRGAAYGWPRFIEGLEKVVAGV